MKISLFVSLTSLLFIFSSAKQNIAETFIDTINSVDAGIDPSDISHLLENFRSLSDPKTNTSRRFLDKSSMRFKETSDNKFNTLIQNVETESRFGTESLPVTDTEMERSKGLENGFVVYQGKRTVNFETAEFADWYWEIAQVETY